MVLIVLSVVCCIVYRNRARRIRCAGEWIPSNRVAEHDRYVTIRNRWFTLGLSSILGLLWTIDSTLGIGVVILGFALLIDYSLVPWAYTPIQKDRL
ncbi:hypothetical protein COU77_02430 [Candidatus Peregrinibacteria bacterium CG10_big_fil_rev_8_21_14_0_10_49_16]|nr:MAG: hypothetical protein COW95_00915 [Candidatus Peregrinibacteria bacterium CG22_combo_CG10-13_8_21_14_all_49_11]PIR52066.1 MAG: hypothetical protein COU77_02430 [Candidatus Peregrinibacteria bacterium CG10_big_fil_rev_8_21_14_0_10_49_16]